MAVSNYEVILYSNGERVKRNTKNLEPLYKSLSVTADGVSNGLDITELAGKFHFNSKILGGVAAGGAAGQVLIFDQIGANNGIAPLDSGGKIPASYLPNSVMEFKGAYNATTNSPTLVDGTGNAGDFYRVTVAGTQDFGSGSITFVVGDYVMYSGTVWEKGHAGADAVNSVNGQTGVVVLTTTNIAEGTNLYYTQARFDTAFAAKTTDNLTEGSTNLYFTTTRARTAAVVNSLAGSQTDQAPSVSAVNAALAVIGNPYATFQNTQGGAVTVRQVAYQDPANPGQAKLAQANGSFSSGSVFLMVKDASIADTASGAYYTPKKGTLVGGFTGLTVGDPIYLSRTAAGGYIQSLTGFVANEHVVSLGLVWSTTEIIWDPNYEYQIGT